MDRTSGGNRLSGDPQSLRTADDTTLVSRSRELEGGSLGAVAATDDACRIRWATPDGLEVVGRGVASRFTASGPDRFDRIRSMAAETFDGLDHLGPEIARPRAFGGVSFHDGHDPDALWTGFDAASFVVPQLLVTQTADGAWITTVADRDATARRRLERWHDRLTDRPARQSSEATPGVRSMRRTTTPEQWTDQVETALERMATDELTKVVLAQALSVTLDGPIDVPGTLDRLRRQYPNCYRFLVDHETGGTFFGAPPERLVSKRGRRVETEALAGSVPRGETAEADDEYVARMVDSEKVQHEHGLVIEAIRDQLEPLARELTVEEQTIRRLATIQHLQTPIEATLEGNRHVLELVEALHPTPAVGGVPPSTALETIRETESFDRGWYAAPIGWFDAAGDGEFAVGIRSGLAADETVTLFAGNGIVADSDPTDEWTEIQLKFRPILDELR